MTRNPTTVSTPRPAVLKAMFRPRARFVLTGVEAFDGAASSGALTWWSSAAAWSCYLIGIGTPTHFLAWAWNRMRATASPIVRWAFREVAAAAGPTGHPSRDAR